MHSLGERQEYTLERCAIKITVGLELDCGLFTRSRNRTGASGNRKLNLTTVEVAVVNLGRRQKLQPGFHLLINLTRMSSLIH